MFTTFPFCQAGERAGDAAAPCSTTPRHSSTCWPNWPRLRDCSAGSAVPAQSNSYNYTPDILTRAN